MEDDYLFEEEEGSGRNRPFLIAAGALLTVFILAAACTAIVLFSRGGSDTNAEAVAIRETENAITMATNVPVTQTVAVMQTEEARPTNTPVPPPTNTPVPTFTPVPTNTPVVAQANEEETAVSPEGEATPNVSGTSVFEQENEEATATPIPAETTTETNNQTAETTAAQPDELPQTGLETWGLFVAAVVLIGVFVTARRLRTN
jgi:hypothetical protein